MLCNLGTIYSIARSSKNFSAEIHFSENMFLVYRGFWLYIIGPDRDRIIYNRGLIIYNRVNRVLIGTWLYIIVTWLYIEKTAETRLPTGNKYSCTSPSFYLSFCSPSFLLHKCSPIIAAQILPYQAALLEHLTCLSYIFATHHRNVDACVLHSPGQK